MNTKLKTVLYWLAALIPLLVTLYALPGLPEELPMQYDFSGQITRMGSKNEMLLLPVITLFVAARLRLSARVRRKYPRGEQTRKVFEFVCGVVTIFLGVISLVMLYYAGNQTQDITQTRALQILSLAMGVLFVVLGNILPKCKRTGRYWLNIGFRTPWTLRSDAVWTKVNRLGGYAMVGSGLAGIIVSLLVPQWWGFMIILGLVIIVALWGVVYSWWLYRNEIHDS